MKIELYDSVHNISSIDSPSL